MDKAKIRAIRLSEAVTDPEVNRELDGAWVNYLIHHWDQGLFRVPVVAEYQGRFITLDGQHTMEALRQQHVDDPRISVEVHYGLTKPEMARMVVFLNKTRGFKPFEKFKKLLYAGEATHCAINAILERNGLKLATGGSSGAVACVKSLLRAFNRDGTGEILEDALKVIIAVWGRDSANFHGSLVGGIALLLHKQRGELDLQRLIKKLKARDVQGASGLIASGTGFKKLKGGTAEGGVAEMALHFYSKGPGLVAVR